MNYGNKTKKIHEYWENNARTHGTSHEASWGDINMVNLEIENISKYIKAGDRVLDAGCANGYSTFHYLERKPASIRAFDYSSEMIARVKKGLKKNKINCEVGFYEADICDIPEKDGYFDVSITTRVLINLPSWHLQKKAMDEMFRVTKPGGSILFSEAFTGGLKNINKLRKIFNLEPLAIHSFNKYLDEKTMERYLKNKKAKYEVINFSSIYYIGSRVIREMYLDGGEKQSFKHFINDFFFDLEKKRNKLDFGIQKLYVIRK